MIRGFRELEVYQRAYAMALEIHSATMTFPRLEQHELGSQIRRATKSIAYNIAEGYGKNTSVPEFKRYLAMALGSCEETHVQLDFCRDLGYITELQHEHYEEEYNIIGKMLNKMLQTWR